MQLNNTKRELLLSVLSMKWCRQIFVQIKYAKLWKKNLGALIDKKMKLDEYIVYNV